MSTGHEITCVEAADGVTEVTLRHLAIDHVMPRVLNLLGIESLHATAVAGTAGACAFIGDAGTGKSTLAASFHLNGMYTFCDDCLVLREDRGNIMAMPAYPGVRLWDDSLKAVMTDADRGQPVAQYTSKTRLLGDAASFRTDTLPLARIYFLQRPTAADDSGDESRSQIESWRPRLFRCWLARAFLSTSPTTGCSRAIFVSSCASPRWCRCDG